MKVASPMAFSRQEVDERYTGVAVVLHWAIAAFILSNLGVGYFMESFPGRWRVLAVSIHVSSGISVLVLSLARIVWRVVNPPPPFVGSTRPWERHAAHFVHLLLYGGMLIMPLIGWSIVSAHPPAGSPGAAYEAALRIERAKTGSSIPPAIQAQSAAILIWWTLPLPLVKPVQAIGATPGGVAPQVQLHDELVRWHGLGGYLLIVLLALHVLGALKHQLIDHEPQFRRMALGRGVSRSTE